MSSMRRDAAAGDDRDLHVARQFDRRLDVDAAHHAVAADIGVKDRLDAVVLELLREIGDVVAGELAPAVGGDLAALGIERDDDMAREGTAGVVQEPRVLHGRRADHDVADAVVDVAFDRVEIADAAAQLDRQVIADRLHHLADHRLVDRAPGARRIEVDDVQAARALLAPVPRHGHRVVREHRDVVVHVALTQAHAVTVLEVDGGDQQHHGRPGVGRVQRGEEDFA